MEVDQFARSSLCLGRRRLPALTERSARDSFLQLVKNRERDSYSPFIPLRDADLSAGRVDPGARSQSSLPLRLHRLPHLRPCPHPSLDRSLLLLSRSLGRTRQTAGGEGGHCDFGRVSRLFGSESGGISDGGMDWVSGGQDTASARVTLDPVGGVHLVVMHCSFPATAHLARGTKKGLTPLELAVLA